MWEDLGIIGFHVFLRCAMWVSLAFLNTDYSSGKSCKNWLAAPGRDFFWCLQTKTVQSPSLKKIRLSPTVFFASLPPMYAIHLHILALGKCNFFQKQFQTICVFALSTINYCTITKFFSFRRKCHACPGCCNVECCKATQSDGVFEGGHDIAVRQFQNQHSAPLAETGKFFILTFGGSEMDGFCFRTWVFPTKGEENMTTWNENLYHRMRLVANKYLGNIRFCMEGDHCYMVVSKPMILQETCL